MSKGHVRGSDVRGVGRLAVDATLGLTRLVETVHHNILRTPGIFGSATQEPAKGLTGLVYRTIRGVTRLVGGGVDALLGQLSPLVGEGIVSSPEREAVLAGLNGVLGDRLAAQSNPLAIALRLRRGGVPLTLSRAALARDVPAAGGRILVLLHGLCMSDLQWLRRGHDHGAALERDEGFCAVHVHFNSGLHVSQNGRELSRQLEALVHAWPVEVTELAMLGYSMGGLVARSACQHAAADNSAWMRCLRRIVFLGTPHFGAPLERGGNWIDRILDSSPYTTAFSRLGKLRSAGITDLRHGSLCDADWQSRDRFARSDERPAAVPLPSGVRCHAIAASVAKKRSPLREKAVGDGLVPLASALGKDADPARSLAIDKADQWVGYGMNHLDLLDREDAYAQIRRWLASAA
ncbi:MAG: hypothetical protein ABI846_13020 [Rudaea sp.]